MKHKSITTRKIEVGSSGKCRSSSIFSWHITLIIHAETLCDIRCQKIRNLSFDGASYR